MNPANLAFLTPLAIVIIMPILACLSLETPKDADHGPVFALTL